MAMPFSFKNKLKTAGTLFVLCLIVLLSNIRIQYLWDEMADSIETIYKDRLVVQDLIFSYSRIIEELTENETLLVNSLSETMKGEFNDLNIKYLDTKLTQEEALLFTSFSKKLNRLGGSELDVVSKKEIIKKAKEDLFYLELIQMSEAKKEMANIRRLGNDQLVSFYLESAVLVILLLVMQVLILRSTIFPKQLLDNASSMN